MQRRTPKRAAVTVLAAIALSACVTIDSMLAPPAAEVGNSYAMKTAKMFCSIERETCSSYSKKNFTVDNGAVLAKKPVAIIHVVFDDGTKGWFSYSAFVEQGFGPPVETRRKVKHDMSPDDIKATWGAPDAIAPETKYGRTIQVWTYKGIGRISFLNDKVIEVELEKSLPALE